MANAFTLAGRPSYVASGDAWRDIPADLRGPVTGGMRWTLWLAAAAVPFSYATRVLLARLGPECLAIYGLLLVYIGFVSGFLFLGGNAVAIRYLPALAPARRADFLRTYALVIGVAWLPWVVVAGLDPGAMAWLFGGRGRGFELVMMALAPLPILFSLLLAALKGMLDLTWAQALYRGVTVGMLAGVLLLYVTARTWFVAHAAGIIWGMYLGLTAVGCLAALARWQRLAGTGTGGGSRPRWYLPPGFWSYGLGLQGSSMLGFVATQIDVLLMLHVGGLKRLGSYVAIMTLAALATTALKLLLDAFMAALTHGLARSDAALTGDLFDACCRLLLPLILVMGIALTCLAAPLLAVYGPGYTGLQTALRWLGPCAALDGLNCVLGSALGALGHPQAEVKAKLVRLAAYLALFLPLWHAWGLTGAVLAWGAAEIPYQAVNLWCLRRLAPFRLRWRRLYPAFLAAIAGLALLAPWGDALGTATRLGVGALLVAGFVLMAGYSPAELAAHLRIFLPGQATEGSL